MPVTGSRFVARTPQTMSLPTTGRFEAAVLGCQVHFDGQVWSSPDEMFDPLVGPALAAETPRQVGTHITCPDAARRILERLFPGAWTEISAECDTWPNELGEDAED